MHRFIASVIAVVTIMSFPPAIVGFTHTSFFRSQVSLKSSNRHDIDVDAINCDRQNEPSSILRWGKSPYLAILTEPDACTSIARVEETIRAIELATTDGGVDLVVLRVADELGGECALHKWALLRSLAEMKIKRNFLLVVNDDVDIVLKALSQNVTVDGVHVKERKAHLIPSIRSKLEHAATCSFERNDSFGKIFIGTSCHSIQSAMASYQLPQRGPDYLFVGTCYLTQSHPEKQTLDELEGPSLPGRVKRELYDVYNKAKLGIINDSGIYSQSTPITPPLIFAIGGIDEQNCHEPVMKFGADGVAVIRTVMHAPDPRAIVRHMKSVMRNEHVDLCG
jgi:thiamine-phosphate diphosphorylase